ncbi:serine hydrolase domain-containing protein [Nocardia flavorosea]|uniref:Beta-lactamase family protein n=2 Tax=Nocardia flavorosea TaxID=53429 RepID=A0A846YLQ7_9NOCA|nr:serine hydrolase domain-containing protein [Nocardia flavorosea]NKY60057.1 beta-lactamase family protein [Nocardia flavorosea]
MSYCSPVRAPEAVSYRRSMRIQAAAFSICTAAVLLTACSTAGDHSTAPPVSAARVNSVQADLDSAVGSGAVGAIATLTEGDSESVSTSGVADINARTPIPTDRPQHVRVGSVTKTFTAAIVLQLVAEQKVDLDRPIDTYLPDLFTGTGVNGQAITVRQILGHRSGLPELTGSPGESEYSAAHDGRTFTPDQVIALALRNPAQFAPGARFEYTNTNYLVAGRLIEVVTGHSYGDELRDRIIAPLNLSGTYLPAAGETGLREPHPIGYRTLDGVITDVTRIEPSLPWSAGGLVSTGADLNRFYTALSAGRVVPQPQLQQMLDGVDMGTGDGMFYGLGLGYTRLPCGAQFIGHNGGIFGFSVISGATSAGRAVTLSYTGTPGDIDSRSRLTHALCN